MLTPHAISPRPIYIPTITNNTVLLEDNQTTEMLWSRPDRPIPIHASSSYRRVGCIGDGNCLFHAILKSLSGLYMKTYGTRKVDELTLQKLEQITHITIEDILLDKPRSNDLGAEYEVTDPKTYTAKMAMIRYQFAKALRNDLAYKISTDLQTQKLVEQVLSGSIQLTKDILANTQLTDGEITKQTLSGIIEDLISDTYLPPDILIILSEICNFDFYLLRDVNLTDLNPKNLPLYGGRHVHANVLGPQDLRPESDPNKWLPNRLAIIIVSFNDFHYELIGRLDTNILGQRSIVLAFDQTEPIIRTLYLMLLDLRSR